MSGCIPYHWEAEKRTATGLRYKVVLSDYLLHGESDQPEATMFSFSYIATEQAVGRPVMFAYNGGPGAASAWLHMGLLGPVLAQLPGYPDELEKPARYDLVENADFLLDVCDIVMVDPVGAGWARLLEESAAPRHYSTGGDASDFADFICHWLAQNGRTGAPVYLLGESYGTIRNVALADALPDSVDLRGIIHIGTSLNVGAKTSLYVEPNVRRLGANAAVCWYHCHQNDFSRDEFVAQAMDFAYGDYARALLLGNRMPEEERREVARKLSYFTGISQEFLWDKGLRFSEVDFLIRSVPGAMVSTYDARLLYRPKTGETYSENAMGSADIIEPDMEKDAFMSSVGPVYDEALQQYVAAELCPPQREAVSDLLGIGRRWDYRGYEKDTLSLSMELVAKRPYLKTLFINGYYDLQSTFDFVTYYLSRFPMPEENVRHVVFPSGHASYVGDGMVAAVSKEIREFIKA